MIAICTTNLCNNNLVSEKEKRNIHFDVSRDMEEKDVTDCLILSSFLYLWQLARHYVSLLPTCSVFYVALFFTCSSYY